MFGNVGNSALFSPARSRFMEFKKSPFQFVLSVANRRRLLAHGLDGVFFNV